MAYGLRASSCDPLSLWNYKPTPIARNFVDLIKLVYSINLMIIYYHSSRY